MQTEKKISVIMPCYLGHYDGCAPEREPKFIAAVQSFLKNSWNKKELVIVSDGCEKTNEIYTQKFRKFNNIKLLRMQRHEIFDGSVPQAGCDAATGEILCFLDSDDLIVQHHLSNIALCFTDNLDWVYFNAFYKLPELCGKIITFEAADNDKQLNTGTIAYRKNLSVTWAGHIGIKGNTYIIRQLLEKYPKRKKIYGCGYMICRGEIGKFEMNKE